MVKDIVGFDKKQVRQSEFARWPVLGAVAAQQAVPGFFGRCVDGAISFD
jgi:hypothetical protein